MQKNKIILIVVIIAVGIIVAGALLWLSQADTPDTSSTPTNTASYSPDSVEAPGVFSAMCDQFANGDSVYRCLVDGDEHYILQTTSSDEAVVAPWYVYDALGALQLTCDGSAAVEESCAEYSTVGCTDNSNQCQSPNAFADYPLTTIGEINRAENDYGYYSLTAVVKEIVPCPTCPDSLVCEPCIGDYVVVSAPGDTADETFSEMAVFYQGAAPQLTTGETYDFVVNISGPVVPVTSLAESLGRLVNLVTFASAE